ncbi:MAG TPA: hypothetical protein VM286_08250 [Candidatus Thermoplasmatota archaeon]|nr:hypothetical protein [Candidatus Thermoplasmatota archaeon]
MRAVEVLPQHRELHDKLTDARDWLLQLHKLNAQPDQEEEIRATWQRLRESLDMKLDDDELAAVNVFETVLAEGGKLEEEHFQEFFNALDTVHDDVLLSFQVAPLPRHPANAQARAFEAEILETLRASASELREKRLASLKTYIYKHPGHYVWDVYRRLSGEALFQVSYTALHSYVRDLADRGDILTIGLRQGIKRYCFPHPSRVQDRSRYFDKLFPVDGTVEREVSEDFSTTSVMARIYVVNHLMAPIALVTPADVELPDEVNVQGFGPLLPWSKLEQRYGLKAKVKPPQETAQVVVVQQLEYQSASGPKHVDVSREFLRR